MGKIVRLTENDLTRLVRRVIKEETDLRNMQVIYGCAGIEDIEEVHMDEINPLVDELFNACNSFDDGNWNEDDIVTALENANSSSASGAQKLLTCALPKIGIEIQDSNPLLTICRKAFTTMGFTDIGDSSLKQRAQKALLKFGIKTKI